MNQEHRLITLIKSGEGSSLEFKKCRNMMKYGRAYGGEDPQMIEGDVFRIIVTVPEFGAVEKTSEQESTGEVTPQAAPQVAPQVANMLLVLKGEMNRQELQEALGLKDRFHFRDSYIIPRLKSGVIEMTQPNSPKGPTQKYRLTSKGYEVLNKIE